jgi:hypothetical protein
MILTALIKRFQIISAEVFMWAYLANYVLMTIEMKWSNPIMHAHNLMSSEAK